MKARVTVKFDGCADGSVYPRTFFPGDEIEGDLAASMVAAGMAERLGDSPKKKAPPRNKTDEPERTKRSS